MRYYSRIPFLLLIIGLLASLWTAGRRVIVERAARTVELTVDFEQLRQLALSVGVPLPTALAPTVYSRIGDWMLAGLTLLLCMAGVVVRQSRSP